jgi:Aspartyl protease
MRTLLLAAWLAQPVVIPFTTTPDGFVLIPATVAGNIPVHLILDTGAGFDVLAQSLVDRLQLKSTSQFTGFVMSGDRIDAPLYSMSTIAVGPMVRQNVAVGGLALLDQVHQDGILSMSAFRTQPITIDFVKHVIVLETPASLAVRRKAGTVAPLQFDDYRGIELDLFARFMLGSDTAQCNIDTGSPASTISLRYLETLAVDTADTAVHKHRTANVAGAQLTRYGTNIARLSLAASQPVTVEHPRVSFANIIYDCVVGVDFWAGKAVTFDIPGRQLIVTR